jgi:hypothetical protein
MEAAGISQKEAQELLQQHGSVRQAISAHQNR